MQVSVLIFVIDLHVIYLLYVYFSSVSLSSFNIRKHYTSPIVHLLSALKLTAIFFQNSNRILINTHYNSSKLFFLKHN